MLFYVYKAYVKSPIIMGNVDTTKVMAAAAVGYIG